MRGKAIKTILLRSRLVLVFIERTRIDDALASATIEDNFLAFTVDPVGFLTTFGADRRLIAFNERAVITQQRNRTEFGLSGKFCRNSIRLEIMIAATAKICSFSPTPDGKSNLHRSG